MRSSTQATSPNDSHNRKITQDILSTSSHPLPPATRFSKSLLNMQKSKTQRRVEGMGLKLMKFHAIMHMAQDIMYFGIPMEFDTGSNERGHKVVKRAAWLTQHCEDTFECTRYPWGYPYM